jgi:hypothetical protein
MQAAPVATPACDTLAVPSPCAQPADAYHHDGFYLRLSGEIDYLAFLGLGRGPEQSASVKGVTSGTMLAIGGTVWNGLVVAGMLSVVSTRDDFHGSPHDPEGYATVSFVQLGVLADWYPHPGGGWHTGAALAIGSLSLRDSYVADSLGAAFAGRIFGGYDWWIGPQWSLGLMAVISACTSTSLKDDDGNATGYRFHALSVGIAYALTLH